MYLARKRIDARTHYIIRESFRDETGWHSRDLVRLGTDPSRYVEYPGGRTFYINEEIEDTLREQNVDVGTEDLESVFWPFIREDVRHAQEHFRCRSRRGRFRRRLSYDEEQRLDRQIHEFDRRRLMYLKTGHLDQSRIRALPLKYFRSLADKSRDELEQDFLLQERDLSEDEFKRYVYASFDLQQFFSSRDARQYPQFLNENQMDEAFLNVLCQINRDSRFWREPPPSRFLHEYLVRYVILYFDYSFSTDSFLQDMLRRFINSHRVYRPPSFTPQVLEKETQAMFGKSKKELLAMDKRDLARLYKKKAMEHHPDQGGDQEQFIRLTHVYKSLIHHRRRS